MHSINDKFQYTFYKHKFIQQMIAIMDVGSLHNRQYCFIVSFAND